MKKIIFKSAVTMIAALLFLTSCQKQIQPPAADNGNAQARSNTTNVAMGAPLKKVDLQHVYLQIEDADMNMPTGDATPLFNKNGGQHLPIMTPDGHQLTLGEFNMISGWANLKCVNAGTHVVMHLKGLIPNGVYTIWTLTFKSPGFDGTFTNRIGFGALGAIEGSANSNSFTANAEGNASISVIRPAGKLLTDGSVNPHPDYLVPNCLGDVYETHLALAYHLKNVVASPGPPPTWVVQGFFQFWGSQL